MRGAQAQERKRSATSAKANRTRARTFVLLADCFHHDLYKTAHV